MIFIDGPSVGESIDVWKKHLNDLKKLSPKYQRDKTIISEIKRATNIIQMKEDYANGTLVIDLSEEQKASLKKILEDTK
jgi:hypothetical protein